MTVEFVSENRHYCEVNRLVEDFFLQMFNDFRLARNGTINDLIFRLVKPLLGVVE